MQTAQGARTVSGSIERAGGDGQVPSEHGGNRRYAADPAHTLAAGGGFRYEALWVGEANGGGNGEGGRFG